MTEDVGKMLKRVEAEKYVEPEGWVITKTQLGQIV
jgi:hypothetical protein